VDAPHTVQLQARLVTAALRGEDAFKALPPLGDSGELDPALAVGQRCRWVRRGCSPLVGV
jgi:hypothetical protein